MPARKTLSEVKLEIKKMYSGDYEYHSGKYVNQKSEIRIKHLKSGKLIKTTLKSYREGKNLSIEPKKAHSTKRITLKEFESRLSDLNPSISYVDKENFKGRKYPARFSCLSCGHEWDVKRAEQAIEFDEKKRTGCPICSNKTRGDYLRNKGYLKKVLSESADGSEYSWLEEYALDNKRSYMILHKVCGKVYMARAQGFKDGEQRCPECFGKESRGSRMIKSLLESMGVAFETEKKFPGCVNTNPLPFDFYIEKKDILIEYDGSQHYRPWGSDYDVLERTRRNDSIKNEWAKKNNKTLLRFNYKQTDSEIINTIKEKLS